MTAPAAPRVALATLPTPLDRLSRLGDTIGRELWAKRDDLTGLGLGGNKVRKLEFLLGHALADRADTIVTFGALQSNHARQTAAAAARLGLRCELILTTAVDRHDPLYVRSGNVLLDRLFGATLHVIPNDDEIRARTEQEVRDRLAAAGRRAVWLPPGGSDVVGTLGYVAAAHELLADLDAAEVAPGAVVVPVSTGGTVAGIAVGLADRPEIEVIGVDVYRPIERSRRAVDQLVAATAAHLGIDPPRPVTLTDAALGPGYGVPTPSMQAAVLRLARTEGVLADPVYSGKALAFVLDHSASLPAGPVVLWLTGGVPGVFAYGDDLLDTDRQT